MLSRESRAVWLLFEVGNELVDIPVNVCCWGWDVAGICWDGVAVWGGPHVQMLEITFDCLATHHLFRIPWAHFVPYQKYLLFDNLLWVPCGGWDTGTNFGNRCRKITARSRLTCARCAGGLVPPPVSIVVRLVRLIAVSFGASVKLSFPNPSSVAECFVVHPCGLQVHDLQVRRNLPHGCGGDELLAVQVVVDVPVPGDISGRFGGMAC